MRLRMWTYDLAREQAPTIDHLRRFCDLSLDAGYNAWGIYLEHRFVYASAPWAAGHGALSPDIVHQLIGEYPDLQIIPFVNLLGHLEGMLYTEEGRQFAEEPFKGMQACPSQPAFFELASKLLEDVADAFSSEILHIGGDETSQLGKCTVCAAAVAEIEREDATRDGKSELYGRQFGPLAKRIIEMGRTPAVWGDMFVEHPRALSFLPKETIIFDWQYFSSPRKTAKPFVDAGHPVVVCPTLITYSAPWLHLPQGELNVKEHIQAATELEAEGVCLTTWECGLFGNYETLLPAVAATGKMLNDPSLRQLPLEEVRETAHICQAEDPYACLREAPRFLKSYLSVSETYEEWARLMGVELQDCGDMFAYGSWRSVLKVRLLLCSNPFLLWRHHCEILCGEVGDKALNVLDRAISVAPDASARGVSEFVRIAIEFCRYAEESHKAYAKREPGKAAAALSPARAGFDDLLKIARCTNLRIGGSLADIERCHTAKEHVERVMRRIKLYGDGSLGYLPSFETITHPSFVPQDQSNWWLVNSWANE